MIPQIENFTILEENVPTANFHSDLQIFLWPRTIEGGGEEEKEYQSNSKSKILRFLLNSYFRFDEISSKMFLNCQHRLRLQENNNIRISLFRKEFYIFF